MRNIIIFYLAITSFSTFSFEQENDEKHHEDPTKVITKIGVGYSDDLTFSGSVALDQARKINGNINQDASEWRLGGSWLFDVGIINFSIGRSEYNDGGQKENYSIGTFVPLKAFGIDTGKWMVFPMAGINHNKIDLLVKEEPETLDELIMQQNTSNGGYLGVMALRPITQQWTVMAFSGGGLGSGDYSNLWVGTGASFKLTQNHSFNLFGFLADDTYGRTSKVSVNYTYEFH